MSIVVFTVSQLTEHLKRLLDEGLPQVIVEGEVSRVTYHHSGHVYFTLKDAQSRLDAALFRREAQNCLLRLEEGLQVRVHGRVTVYPPQGRLQLIVQQIEESGSGVLLAQFEALKARLAAEGLFERARKKALPLLPRTVGIVTSPQAAALQDMLRVLHSRFPLRVLLAPAAVQGAGAAREIVAALHRLERVADVDVIILGRGGGSVEDLWPFNDETLVRAVAACPKPTVSAVGHEVDVVLTDFAADLRAPTPTAAAEAVAPSLETLATRVRDYKVRLQGAAQRRVALESHRLQALQAQLRDPRRQFGEARLRLAEIERRLPAALLATLDDHWQALRAIEVRLAACRPEARLQVQSERLWSFAQRLKRAWHSRLANLQGELQGRRRALEALGPMQSLERGFAIVQDPQSGQIVRSYDQVEPGQRTEVILFRGRLDCRVEQSRPPMP